jgi:serine phosphatase RsbU (regulator of sigma subunit)
MRKQTKIIIAIADCTGHGVPGAFMSILGISFLNEITNKIVEKNGHNDLRPSSILNQLKIDIIKSLHQRGREKEAKDGMDLALCIFDIDTRNIQFAGANNPLYLVRNNSYTDDLGLNPEHYIIHEKEDTNAKLFEILPDRTPIGFSKNIEDFVDKEFHLNIGDVIYMFTDGYVDQFGGDLGRKFLEKNLRNLLLDVYEKPMKEQQQILNKVYEGWKSFEKPAGGFYNQVDDILVMGVRF